MGRGSSGRGGGALAGMRVTTSGAPYRAASQSTQQQHEDAIRRLEGDEYGAGTYDLATLQVVEYPDGYQVTFCQIGDNYSAQEYADRVNEFLALSSDGISSAGKFEGTPEVSFHVQDLETAIRLAEKYNQISIYDWKNEWCIETGGTGRRS